MNNSLSIMYTDTFSLLNLHCVSFCIVDTIIRNFTGEYIYYVLLLFLSLLHVLVI